MLEEALPMSRDFPIKPSGAGVDWFKVCGAVLCKRKIMPLSVFWRSLSFQVLSKPARRRRYSRHNGALTTRPAARRAAIAMLSNRDRALA